MTPTRYIVSLDGREHEVVVAGGGAVEIDGRPMCADLAAASPPDGRSLILDGTSAALAARSPARGRWRIDLGGRAAAVEVLDERQARIRELAAIGGSRAEAASVKAPMPGLVVKVAVAEGEVVEAGATVVIVEAMKMENELRATKTARVARILVGPGDAVEKAQTLVELAEAEADG